MTQQYSIKDILKIEVAPALGCTEPAAVALCTAAAGTLLSNKSPDKLDKMDLWLSPNIYKNAFAVAIPGTAGETGIDLAGALGYCCGDPTRKLEVLAPTTNEALCAARQLIKDQKIAVHLLREKTGIYIKAGLSVNGETAEAEIEGTHDNLIGLKLNDQPVQSHPLLAKTDHDQCTIGKLEDYLSHLSLEELLALVENMDEEDYEFVMRGVEYNLELARHGLAFGSGLGIGKTLERLTREGLIKKDMVLAARMLTSAACDARMAGAKLPAMSSAGSGNHGLTAVLPVWAVRDYLNDLNEKDVLKAIALSHIVTGYIKAHTGRLSAVCGCSIAAGAGAAAGIACLMGGNLYHIAGAIKNLISDLAGVICDGAKAGCSLKLATAAGTAVMSALYSLHGINVKDSDGIVALTPEQTMRNMGAISTQGMIETDQTILRIMIEKQFAQT